MNHRSDSRMLELQISLVGRYSIERQLGSGGMGTVYMARDIRLDRLVAIKALNPELASRPEARNRFVEEARTAARLSHPHIIRVYHIEADGNQPLIVMAFVDGETLRQRIRRRGALAHKEAERLFREIAWALAYAHSSGVVHRDLTTSNVLIERDTGRAILVDFGLATLHSESGPEAVFGTPGFLAPEVIRGAPADRQSDLYSLGVIGYTMLAGRPPHASDSTGELLTRHLVEPVAPLDQVTSSGAFRLQRAVMSCLEKQPLDRPTDATSLLATLDRIPEPIELAEPLVDWFNRWERFRPIYAMAAPILGLQTQALLWGYLKWGQVDLARAAAITAALSLTAIPILVHLGAESLALRRLNRLGFGVADIRAAWPHWVDSLERNPANRELPVLASRVVFDLTVIAAICLVVTGAVIVPLVRILGAGTDYWATLAAIAMLGTTAYLAMSIGIGIGFIAPGFRFRPRGRFRRLARWFWNSRFAAAVARLAAWGQHGQLAPTATLHRNTEVSLSIAFDSLWNSLPATIKFEFGNLPSLAGTLRNSAEELRDLAARLQESEQLVEATDAAEAARLKTVRLEVEGRHRETVAMLEQLRLQLLRTLAEQHPTADLTSYISAGRDLELRLVRDIGAYREVRALFGRTTGPIASPSPEPTPA